MPPSYQKSSKFSTIFDDKKSVSYAGLALVDEMAKKLNLIDRADSTIHLTDTAGAPNPGAKIMTLIESFVTGGNYIDDANTLRSGSTEKLVCHHVMAPSTLGTFLRSFGLGNVLQLQKLNFEMLNNAWNMGLGPGDKDITVDIDSTICEVYGKQKEGANYGYTKVLGLHPLIATIAESGEIILARNRRGSAHTSRGADFFVSEVINRIRKAGATGNITLRADSGFDNQYVKGVCKDKGVNYSITAKLTGPVKKAIELIKDEDFVNIDYTDNGIASVGETTYGEANQRLIVRRTKITGEQAQLFTGYQYHAFVTDLQDDKVKLDAFHRDHAIVELNIKDLKENVGLSHMPSYKFAANSAWLLIATIAYNMMIWINKAGNNTKITAKTFRKKFINIAGRITKKARKLILHLPYRWTYEIQWIRTLNAIYGLKFVT